MNGTKLDGMTFTQAATLLRGVPGTKVDLLIIRNSFNKPAEYIVTREPVHLPDEHALPDAIRLALQTSTGASLVDPSNLNHSTPLSCAAYQQLLVILLDDSNYELPSIYNILASEVTEIRFSPQTPSLDVKIHEPLISVKSGKDMQERLLRKTGIQKIQEWKKSLITPAGAK